ncbi:MAG TPA: heme-binding protein [Methylomirabilota bacterium]|nr:heme-binding protein [Methylomirabilota bacterium]
MMLQSSRCLQGFFLTWIALAWLGSIQVASAQQAEDCDPTAPRNAGRLCRSEVRTVIENAAKALDLPMVVAVADRVGNILAVFRKPNAPLTAPGNFLREKVFFQGQEQDAIEVAVSLARTAAFFSNNQAPLSSRTIRFISGIHFPPGVLFTPNAALYGIENTNRGCDFNTTFNAGKLVPRAKSFHALVSTEDLPCNNGDRRGCGLGVLTGKPDLFDSDSQAVNPGGIPLFKGNTVVGGIGVVGAFSGELAEFAAFVGAFCPPSAPGCPQPLGVLPVPAFFDVRERVFIDGIRLPFVAFEVPEVIKGKRPKGAQPGTAEGEFLLEARDGACFDETENGGVCRAAPEGYLIGPRAGQRLTQPEVEQIVQQSRDFADRTRAAIRFPRGSRTKMMIAVSDVDGSLLAVYRMPDATVFSIDVSITKARNVVFFSGLDPNVRFDLPGLPVGTAVTNRTISFGSQPLYPPGIDTSSEGPFFRSLYVRDTLSACTQGSQQEHPEHQSGIVFFPGSLPLYKEGQVVGGLGISGDGVEQDDYVTAGGAKGFEPPDTIRADQFFVRGVRSAYLKFPRNPEK